MIASLIGLKKSRRLFVYNYKIETGKRFVMMPSSGKLLDHEYLKGKLVIQR